ncbi:MAG: arginine--tRNA ligase [Flavobacteriales bacterium]|nr:arginine--tRNA ligase [Flavobacteriales bacterium]
MLVQNIQKVIFKLYGTEVSEVQVQLQKTRKDFDGDITLVVFPLLRISKGSPEKTGEQIGEALQNLDGTVESFNVVKGFLNISFTAAYWVEKLEEMKSVSNYGFRQKGEHSRNIMVEYSSPNTNKPLHLGHVRNNLLGYSVSEILKANGHEVQKVQIINDRGIHICKSMLAWQKFGEGETPETSGLKGDKLVGKYYVIFDQKYKAEIAELLKKGKPEEEAKKDAPLMAEARQMLLKWEADDAEVRQLWTTMNGWVYKGFEETYKRLGVDFDKLYYESDTYISGRNLVLKGVEDGLFQKREDGSVWCDLTDVGLDQKLLLRADGTTVYMTQDLGTAKQRYNDWPALNQLIYTVGNEQDYHFKVLFLILKKLGFTWAENCYHLSYGMVDLPSGKMKSREGTVVDADDLMDEMVATAKQQSEEKGKIDGMPVAEADALFSMLGIGALKYFMLKVDPKKNMLFNPAESIDMQGNTGPFIQYTHARIRSIITKADRKDDKLPKIDSLEEKERSLVRLLHQYPETIQQAGTEYSPALIANYAFELAKEYNQFYHECPILKEENEAKRTFRIVVSELTANVIASAMKLLGVKVPERM